MKHANARTTVEIPPALSYRLEQVRERVNVAQACRDGLLAAVREAEADVVAGLGVSPRRNSNFDAKVWAR